MSDNAVKRNDKPSLEISTFAHKRIEGTRQRLIILLLQVAEKSLQVRHPHQNGAIWRWQLRDKSASGSGTPLHHCSAVTYLAWFDLSEPLEELPQPAIFQDWGSGVSLESSSRLWLVEVSEFWKAWLNRSYSNNTASNFRALRLVARTGDTVWCAAAVWVSVSLEAGTRQNTDLTPDSPSLLRKHRLTQ